MVNKGSLEYVSKKPAQMNDGQGGTQTSGQVIVDKPVVRGRALQSCTSQLTLSRYGQRSAVLCPVYDELCPVDLVTRC